MVLRFPSRFLNPITLPLHQEFYQPVATKPLPKDLLYLELLFHVCSFKHWCWTLHLGPMVGLEHGNMKHWMDPHGRGQVKLVGYRVHNLYNWEGASPLGCKFSGEPRVQSKVISLELHVVSNNKGDVSAMLVCRGSHTLSSTCQIGGYKFLHIHTLLNKLINTNNFVILQLRKGMVKGHSRIKAKHNLTRRNLSATVAASIQSESHL